MNITIKNNITGLINSIEFKLFEEFNTQNEYMGYLIHSMNINMDSILHIKARTQQHFTKEHLRMYLLENGFMEEALKNTAVKRIAQMEYCEMMSSICIESCMVHYKKTLRPDLERRKKLADEYQRNFLGNLDEKKLNAINLETLNIDMVEYKTIYDFQRKENYIQYLYDMCFLNEDLFQQYLLEYRDNSYTEELTKEDMEMLFAIKSIKEIYNNYKEVLRERISE